MICDFGCSSVLFASLSLVRQDEGPKGTCQYMAPELVDPDAVEPSTSTQSTEKTDVWAFGIVLYVRLASAR